MLADLHAGSPCGDRPKLAADRLGGVRFEVEAFVLREPAGEEDVDHAAPARAAWRRGAERRQFAAAEPEQADGAGLDQRAPRETGMLATALLHKATPRTVVMLHPEL